jgi:hypothetical protein
MKVPLTVRIPEGLRRQLARLAKQRGNSLNTEILQRLQASIEGDAATPVLERFRALLAETEARRR